MVKILTLFLGLSAGIQPVELGVGDTVASVEILLNGTAVTVVEGPPWSFDLDLGSELLPHRLTAVGRDHEGLEIGRDHRLINLGEGRKVPPLGPCEPPCRTTAIAVEIEGKAPAAEEMDGWFLARGQPVRAHSLQRGPAELLVVRDPAVQPWLELMAHIYLQIEAGVRLPAELSGAVVSLDRETFQRRADDSFRDSLSRHRLAMAWESWQRFLRLDAETEVRFLSPVAAPVSSVEERKQIFNVTRPLDAQDDGVLYHLARIRPLEFELRISDAVALAGLQAHTSRKRRAVLVMLTDVGKGRSRYGPEEVRRYLENLGVPLFVWSFEQPFPEWQGREIIDYRNHKATLSPAKSQALLRRVGSEFDVLRRTLDEQRVVWLEGIHLPQDIKLSPRAHGIRLAGGQSNQGGE